MDSIQTVFSIAVFIISVMMHEVSHGYTANALGDPTAKFAGRLTLNPLKHIDMFGSVILPLVLVLSGAPFVFGWAKPVPYNPYNLRNKKWGSLLVAIAGPLSNLAIAVSFGLLLRAGMFFGYVNQSIVEVVTIIVFVNVLLAIFNLIPIPPLDGSKILMAFLPFDWKLRIERYEQYFFIIFILFVVSLWQFMFPIVTYVATLILGKGLF
ncbi:MAG: site-2 protease family protein [Candidatus Paceibacterota bacterium]|jgi:Zn-dependent protease